MIKLLKFLCFVLLLLMTNGVGCMNSTNCTWDTRPLIPMDIDYKPIDFEHSFFRTDRDKESILKEISDQKLPKERRAR
ncbi:hypothetical protein BVY04_04630, partial [bacterium M21]